jgi:hypothetical protein
MDKIRRPPSSFNTTALGLWAATQTNRRSSRAAQRLARQTGLPLTLVAAHLEQAGLGEWR